MPQVIISDENFLRLQKLAVPLVDTVDTVISKALDALEVGSDQTSDKEKIFIAAAAPDLSFTSVRAARVDGRMLPTEETYWNGILVATIRAAWQHGATLNQISSNLLANHYSGVKDEGGYKPIPDVGLSVQGQDAKNAWKSTAYLASAFGIPVEVAFIWQNNPRAALPGQAGRMSVGSSDKK
jgi:hypothetical protein